MTFLNTLNLFNVGEIFVNFIAGLYTSVAKAYSLLMTFAAGGTSTSIANKISEFAKSAYTLVGIFMVFRLAISILTYLIDPEKMNDKQVGTSKLISRIVVSVVLLLSLNTFIFPTLRRIEDALLDNDSIIFNIFPNPFDTSKDENSYWKNMNSIINNNTILNNKFNLSNTIIPTVKAANEQCNINSMKGSTVISTAAQGKAQNGTISYIVNNCTYPNNNIKSMISLIMGAYYKSYKEEYRGYVAVQKGLISTTDQYNTKKLYSFATNDSLSSADYGLNDCSNGMGVFTQYVLGNAAGSPKTINKNRCYTIEANPVTTLDSTQNGIISNVTFSDEEESSGTKTLIKISYYSYQEGSTVGKKYYYAEYNSNQFSGKIIELDFNHGKNNDYMIVYKNSNMKDELFRVKSLTGQYQINDYQLNTLKLDFDAGYFYSLGAENGRLDNTSTLKRMSTIRFADENLVFRESKSGAQYICRGLTIQETVDCVMNSDSQIAANTTLYDMKQSMAAEGEQNIINGLGFARSILSSFTDKPDVITGEVEEGSGKFMESSAANDALGRMAEDKEIMFDWFLAIIAGIGVIVYMWILCIEVIVRNMKLILLQIIAPIPVICYMNPNDKILNSWFKQYMGTYLDLFVKLLAINAGFRFIPLVINAVEPTNGFATFLIYCGGFLFIKAAPTFISKVFGLENMAGTFKDAAGIVKTGLMAGAGAVAGGVAGAVSGMGKGATFSTVAGGLFGGAARGLSSGAKGKILDGAKTQVGRNTKAKGAYLDGASWGQRMLSKVGMDTASRTDRGLKDLESDSKQYEAFKKHKENIDQTAESSNFVKDLRSQKLADGSARYSESQIKTARKNFINHNSNTNNKGYVSSFEMTDNAGNKVMISAGYEDSKASAIQSELTKAEYNRSGSSTISKVADAKISDYGSLDAADTAITIEKTATDEAIYAAKNTDAYRVGDASRNSNNNGNK